MSAVHSHAVSTHVFLSPTGCKATSEFVTTPVSLVTVRSKVGPTPGTGLTSNPVSYVAVSEMMAVIVLSNECESPITPPIIDGAFMSGSGATSLTCHSIPLPLYWKLVFPAPRANPCH